MFYSAVENFKFAVKLCVNLCTGLRRPVENNCMTHIWIYGGESIAPTKLIVRQCRVGLIIFPTFYFKRKKLLQGIKENVE